ncbi:VanZ family protein [Thiovibrio sp. JS02]
MGKHGLAQAALMISRAMPGARLPGTLKLLQFSLFLAYATYASLSPYPSGAMEVVSDKLIHTAGYFLFYLSTDLAFAQDRLRLNKLLLLFAYSMLIEICQYFIPSRSFSLLDLMANLAGLLLGLTVCAWAHRRFLTGPARRS